jgi:hypothetical protein
LELAQLANESDETLSHDKEYELGREERFSDTSNFRKYFDGLTVGHLCAQH